MEHHERHEPHHAEVEHEEARTHHRLGHERVHDRHHPHEQAGDGDVHEGDERARPGPCAVEHVLEGPGVGEGDQARNQEVHDEPDDPCGRAGLEADHRPEQELELDLHAHEGAGHPHDGAHDGAADDAGKKGLSSFHNERGVSEKGHALRKTQ